MKKENDLSVAASMLGKLGYRKMASHTTVTQRLEWQHKGGEATKKYWKKRRIRRKKNFNIGAK